MKKVLKRSWVGRWVLIPYRFWYANKYFTRPWGKIFPWLFNSRETVNFTYELTDLCRESMCVFAAQVAGVSPDQTRAFLRELDEDKTLREHVSRHTKSSAMSAMSDTNMNPGKRTLYYLLVRALKPKFVFEGGVDKGLGSIIMASALMRNRDEGSPGTMVCCDISQSSGFLVKEPYDQVAILVIDDAIKTIKGLKESVDLFIQDVAPAMEKDLLEAVAPHLSERAVLLSVWHTGDMMRFAEKSGRKFFVFVEETKNHWYPGCKLAVAFPDAEKSFRKAERN